MPVSKLYVEGILDAEVLTSIVSTMPGVPPAIVRGGSKGSLRPKVTEERKRGVDAYYLRDRDFDTDPLTACNVPSVDKVVNGVVHGWRWCRHAIENYLLEPAIVARATGWAEADFQAALLGAARSLVHYTAARWTVGVARRALPPMYELSTRPDMLKNEIKVPANLSDKTSRDWVLEHIGNFREQIENEFADSLTDMRYEQWSLRLGAVSSSDEALLLHAGKDLVAVLEPLIAARRPNSPVAFLHKIRDWIIMNPAEALLLLPEWAALLPQLA